MKKIAVIGSTGSIGRQVLNVIRRWSDRFEVTSLAAGGNARLFLQQITEFKPKIATLAKGDEEIETQIPEGVEYFCGENAFTNAICEEADVVVIALVGFKGIIAVLDAIAKKKNIALANKESLVAGGELVMRFAKENGVKILPVDSEHSAIWQALNFDFSAPFKKLILTASGGAFRDYTYERLKTVTAQEALKHPNWKMGAKITVDCATLVNKGFEVIEAKWLYNAPFDKIDVIIHRESVIHSMVELYDGAIIAQMSYPSMELPIQLALTYPERINTGIRGLDFPALHTLTFEAPDKDRFPCLDCIINAGKSGGLYPAVANAANECAVNLFLQNRITFTDIYRAIDGALNAFEGARLTDFGSIERADDFSRRFVNKLFGV